MFRLIFGLYLDGKITREEVIRRFVNQINDKDLIEQTILMAELVNFLQGMIAHIPNARVGDDEPDQI